MEPTTYFFSQDEDSHWYMIPTSLREEWNRLSRIDEAWDLPEWEQFEDCSMGGGIEDVEFIPVNKN